jgi:hypothetical protein
MLAADRASKLELAHGYTRTIPEAAKKTINLSGPNFLDIPARFAEKKAQLF